jgi:hypothetical protein
LHTPFVSITRKVAEKDDVYDGRRQLFIEWENQIFSLRLN